MGKLIDITGQKFGRLTVIRQKGNTKRGNSLWLCRCNCSNEMEVIVRGVDLRKDRVRSCGCLQKEVTKQRSTKHGHNSNGQVSLTYHSWTGIIQRCTNINYIEYRYYGGRGITVCKRWRKFENFLEDMGETPKGHQVDRINNDGNYCKSNCRWVTPKQNSRNRRNNHMLTFNGKTLCISAWSEVVNIASTTILMRIRRGWTTTRALTAHVKTKKENINV